MSKTLVIYGSYVLFMKMHGLYESEVSSTKSFVTYKYNVDTLLLILAHTCICGYMHANSVPYIRAPNK